MARRRSGPGFGGRRPAPTRQPAAQQTAVAPQPAAGVAVQQPSGPGFLSNVASTAVGVGIGHTIAHGLTGALYGNSSHEAQTQQQQPQQTQQRQMTGCQTELEQFINCTQQQYDLSMCEGLNQVLKECKMRYASPSM